MTWRWLAAAVLVGLYAAGCWRVWRRVRDQAARDRQDQAAMYSAAPVAGRDEAPLAAAPVLIGYASQTGEAEQRARETAQHLRDAGCVVRLCPLNALTEADLHTAGAVLWVVSTCGEGDAPDNAAVFASQMMASPQGLPGMRYGLLALGDRQYVHFCGFGRALQRWLAASGAQPVAPMVEMDNGDPAAWAQWGAQLTHVWGTSTGDAAQPLHAASTLGGEFAAWTLAVRRHLNPGSCGRPIYHLELAPPPGHALAWESGDIAQVRVPADMPHPRDYSIASVVADGRLHLLVRVQQRDDGTPGLASHWLCETLPLGGTVDVRVHSHPAFRLGANRHRPLVLIGNGSGLAGLRGHLHALAAAGPAGDGAGRVWLLYGERQAAYDFHYRDELLHWQATGLIAHLDLAFSRDQRERVYVQHRLAAQAARLREWVAQGAAIYVCGSRHGMAQAVDATLREALGNAAMDALLREGRYCRDVY